ncbi:restriction endonuclease subunit S [Streptomyces nigrescens]|uniref:restriction endonuclease subunit S n=1 Tax=Streptomyces nigrescens TaxID=1920 RepID=UPI00225896AA|nr:restriction endonuclease subunit S [Streptomyces libani]MCX5445061.1 restriction endonuclease subunit S [Streptomyces libani]
MSTDMGGLTEGWVATSLDQVCDVNGGIQKQAKRRPVVNKFPFLRVANVGRGTLDLSEVHEVELFEGELDRFRLKAGDLLVVEGNGSPDQIGRAATWRGAIPDAVHQNHLIRVRPTRAIDPKFLELLWNSPVVKNQLMTVAQSSSGLYTLSTAKLKRVQLNLPPLAEQLRIVEALEEQLSRLDAAEQTLRLARKRIEVLRKSVFTSLVPETAPAGWTVTTVGEAGTLELGRARHPDWHHGPEMRPYLRVANVFEDRIDISSIMEMDFSGIFEKYRLHQGDILLNEGQSPHLVGRPAMYRGVPENVAFTNSLLRFQAGPGVLPEWALMVFRRHLHARRFMREVRITTNIAHLSSKRLKAVEFPIPPLEIQKDLVQRCEELLSGTEAIGREVDRATRRADALRLALLRKAFNGNLLPQNPADEPASTLLARITAERDAAKPARTTKRTVHPRKTTAAVTEAAPAPTPAPVTSVQQELFQ